MRALPRTVYCVCKANYVLVTHWSDVGAHFPFREIETVLSRPLPSPQKIDAKEIPKENVSCQRMSRFHNRDRFSASNMKMTNVQRVINKIESCITNLRIHKF